jgi:dihydrofolate reductase
MISMIAAMSLNRVIGKNNKLPWNLPLELQHLRKTTMGHHFIIGRKTFEAVGSRALPGRKMIVVTSDHSLKAKDVIFANSLVSALDIALSTTDNEIFIGGGTRLFEEGMELADRIYLTTINTIIDGDTFFPPIDHTLWNCISNIHHEVDDMNEYSWDIQILDKI